MIRDAGTGSGAAQRELARLEHTGLIVARRIGNQKHYQANASSPLFADLRTIVRKTVGLVEPVLLRRRMPVQDQRNGRRLLFDHPVDEEPLSIRRNNVTVQRDAL